MTKKELKKMESDLYIGKSIRHAIDVAVEYGNVARIEIVQSGITRFVAIISTDGQMAIRTWAFVGSAEKYDWKIVNPNGFIVLKTLWTKR
jgi:hypothetical protein